MSGENSFQELSSSRSGFIDDYILQHVSEADRVGTKQRINDLTDNFQGVDRDALAVLFYAARGGKLDEYLGKLGEYHDRDLKFVHPEARRVAQMPGATKVDRFFGRCFKELGVNTSR